MVLCLLFKYSSGILTLSQAYYEKKTKEGRKKLMAIEKERERQKREVVRVGPM